MFEACFFKNFGHKSIPGGSDSQNCFFLNWVKKGKWNFRSMFFARNSVTKVSPVARIDKTVFFLIELRKGNAILRACFFKTIGYKSIPGGSDSQNCFFLNWVKKGECNCQSIVMKLIFRAPTINSDKNMSCWHTV